MSKLTHSQSRIKKANYYLLYSSLSELMIELLEETKGTNFQDLSAAGKLKNLRADFERNSSKIHKMLGVEESELVNFYQITEIINKMIRILMSNAHDMDLLSNTIGMIEAWTQGNVSFFESEDQLIQTAKELQ